ncbi:hypothetical protein V1524DRAFT_440708, partial [Lipomyces starkeyi]
MCVYVLGYILCFSSVVLSLPIFYSCSDLFSIARLNHTTLSFSRCNCIWDNLYIYLFSLPVIILIELRLLTFVSIV